MPVKLKKGSAEAKAFMAKLRAAKDKPKLKVPAKLKKGSLGAVKKKAPAKSYHKDTKSHNVNVRVVSGLDKVTHKGRKTNVHYSRMSGVHTEMDMYAIRDSIEKTISQNLRLIELAKNDKSLTKPIKAKMLKTYRANLASYKKMLREQNRLISSNLK